MRKMNEHTANLALAQAIAPTSWKMPAPKRTHKVAHPKLALNSFRALFKFGKVK